MDLGQGRNHLQHRAECSTVNFQFSFPSTSPKQAAMGPWSFVPPWRRRADERVTPGKQQQQQNTPQQLDSGQQSTSARQRSVHEQSRQQQSAGRAVSMSKPAASRL